jgi:hypothetical protein
MPKMYYTNMSRNISFYYFEIDEGNSNIRQKSEKDWKVNKLTTFLNTRQTGTRWISNEYFNPPFDTWIFPRKTQTDFVAWLNRLHTTIMSFDFTHTQNPFQSHSFAPSQIESGINLNIHPNP